MATIDYKEKYEQALEKARQLCAYPTSKPFISDLQDLFPELAESEDERIRKELIDFVNSRLAGFPQCEKFIAWIEKQGDNTAWSEEDKTILKAIIMNLEECSKTCAIPSKEYVLKCIIWLKSLKDRITWKPSDEQMKALNYVVNLMASSERPTENDLYYNILKSLREQLKKLRGE